MSDHYDRYNGMEELLSTNLAEVGTDCISRQQAIEAVRATLLAWSYMPEWRDNKIIEAIKRLPPIQPAEPKRGKWISGGVPFYCSECGENTWDTVMGKPRWNFCPNCGADMRQKGENNESN